MKKLISSLLLLSCSFSVFAQGQSLQKLSEDVKQLIVKNADKLDANDQIQVRKNLRHIINLFRVNGYDIPSNSSLLCDSNNNQLRDMESGGLIHDFSAIEACREALENVKLGKSFCDYDNNTLYRTDGQLIHDFSDATNCRDAIESIVRVRKYCDYQDNTLRKDDGTLIYDFSSREDCLSNLN